jgi:drug/metabolite transporter (DMT)-like permease
MGLVYSGGFTSMMNDDLIGMSLMFLSAAIYALMLVLIRREKADKLEATFWQNLVGALIFLPVFISTAGTMSPEAWLWSGMNGLAVGTVGFVLLFSAFNRLPAAVVGHTSYLEVIFGVIWGVSIFGEQLSWRHIAGGGLVVASLVLRAEIERRRALPFARGNDSVTRRLPRRRKEV